MRTLIGFTVALIAATASAQEVRLNQIQVVGTHNSYSQPADPRVFDVLGATVEERLAMGMSRMPEAARALLADEHPNLGSLKLGLEYMHPPIEAQLALGLRSLELDLNVDPAGGLYLDPLAYRQLRALGETDLAPIYSEALGERGMKVLHIADLDFRSHCPTFRLCLTQMKAWSDRTPGHSPVFVLLEPKSSGLTAGIAGATLVPPFDAAAFDEVDAAILEILGAGRIITPDDLRGTHQTLEAAALAGDWPTLSASRGRFIFLYIVPGLNLAAFAPYLEGTPSLQGRAAFVQGRPGMAHAAFVMVDNALTRGDEITRLVRAGYLVRSRTDIDAHEARVNDVSRREAALASGAQILSTDYPQAPNIFGNDYRVSPFPEGARCNPVNAPVCDPASIAPEAGN